MLTYRNEAAFSIALCKALRTKGWFVQRIESGQTGKGIPDIYAISPSNRAHWFELKRIHHIMGPYETIPWRPGQQSWLHDVTRRGQSASTICCFDDGIAVILHDTIYVHNMVDMSKCSYCHTIRELII